MPWADLLSLSRLPLGVLFWGFARSPSIGIAIISVAALTDVLDGWVARRASAKGTQVDFSVAPSPSFAAAKTSGPADPTTQVDLHRGDDPTTQVDLHRGDDPTTQVDLHRGDWLDPLCDKLFIACVLAGLACHFGSPWRLVAVLLVREWLQLASITIYALVPRLRKHGPYNYRANNLGKATTVFQFVTGLVILFGTPAPWGLAGVTAALGVCSLATYIARVAPKAAR